MTCKAVMGLLKNTAGFTVDGQILLNGSDIMHLPEKDIQRMRGRDMGFVMQNPMTAFNPLIKVGSHVTEAFSAHTHMRGRKAYAAGVEMLKRMDLKRPEELMNSYPFALSGGMLQRIMIGLAISLNPGLLIADEPTTALDVKNQAMVLHELEKIKRDYMPGILLVTHDFGVIAQIADEVAVMRNGKIVEKGAVHKIFSAPEHPYTKELLGARLLCERGQSCSRLVM